MPSRRVQVDIKSGREQTPLAGNVTPDRDAAWSPRWEYRHWRSLGLSRRLALHNVIVTWKYLR